MGGPPQHESRAGHRRGIHRNIEVGHGVAVDVALDVAVGAEAQLSGHAGQGDVGAECMAQATSTTNPDEKKQLQEMAEGWLKLARLGLETI
jgi:hypothetical protein